MVTDEPGLVDVVRRSLSRGGVVAVTGGRGAGRTTRLRRLSDALPATWSLRYVDGRSSNEELSLDLGGSQNPVLIVDDPHLLPRSMQRSLLGAVASDVPLLCSMTDEAAVSTEVAQLVVGAVEVPTAGLDDDDIGEMAEAALGALPDDIGIALLARVTGRRPGLLQRLLHGAEVRLDGDVAYLSDAVVASSGAIAWRQQRLSDPALHRAARLITRDEELRRDQVAAVVGADTIERGFGLGLLRAVGEGLALRDPLLAAVTAVTDRVTHGPDDAGALLDALGERADEARRRFWAVESGREADPGARAAVAAHLLERDQPRLALRLLGSDVDAPQHVVVRARALTAVGRSEEAIHLFEGLVDTDDAEAVAATAAVRVADHRFFRGLDPAGALEVLSPVTAGDSGPAREAAALEALVHSVLGHEGLATTDVDLTHGPTRLVADLRQVLAGQVRDVADIALLDDAQSLAGLPMRERSGINQVFAALHVEGVHAGRVSADALVERAVASQRPGALAQALGMRGFAEQLGGNLVRAERTLRAASLRAEVDDEAGLPELLRATRATVLAELGRLDEATALLSDLQERPNDLRVRLFGAGARVRVLAATDNEAAAVAAVGDIEVGAATGHNVWAALVGLHAARIGLAAAVAESVEEATAGTWGLSVVAADVVRALASGDRTTQQSAASGAADFGLRRVAAEVLLRAGANDEDRRRAAALLEGLGAPRPDAAVQSEPLTPRELQVSRLAASGSTSRDIGEQLGVSVRTVDNHLRRAYRKLGISSRAELTSVLGGSSD